MRSYLGIIALASAAEGSKVLVATRALIGLQGTCEQVLTTSALLIPKRTF